jgi:DNA-binding winged helix-turn-helix (wHTH) protein
MVFRFGNCELNVERHSLLQAGVPVHVEPQVFALLVLLLRRAPELVTYDEMIAEVWEGRIVSDATLAARISAARQAIGDDGKRQAVIRTVARRGVQLVVDVISGGAPEPDATPAPAARIGQSIRYARSQDGTAIAWADCGEGPPLLRAGHWLSHLEHDLNSKVSGPLIRRQSRGRRLVRYDPRGTGLSDRDVDLGSATVRDLADDLGAVADAAGLDRFPIYAISQSVPVALTFAARHPDRVSRLILHNGLLRGSSARGDTAQTDAMIAMIRSGWGVPDSAFMRAIATVFVPRCSPDELDSLARIQSVSASPEAAAEIRRIVGEIDVSACLDEISCPTLVVHFSGDAVQPVEGSRQIAKGVRGAEMHIFDSPNHMLVPSDPVWPAAFELFETFLDAEV